MKNKYIVGYEEKNRQGFKPTFINVKAFDDIKEAYLFWYELKTEKNRLAYILDKESGRRFYYVYEIRELFPRVELTPDTKIKEWYAYYSPGDYQLDKIRDDITFQNLVDEIKEGKDWNSIISVDQTSLDSIIREVLFKAAAEAVGITEDELYKLWLKEDYCEDLNEEYDDTNSDDFGNKIAYLANDEIEAIKGYETAIELFTNDYGVDNKDTIIDKLKEIEDEEKHHLDELKELYKLITGEEMVEIEDEPLEKEPEQLEENLSTNDFLDWHENYYKKDSGFDKKIEQLYTILDKYGKEDEDVDKVYEKCSDEDKEKITKIIKFETLKEDWRKDIVSNSYSEKYKYEALKVDKEFADKIVAAMEDYIKEANKGWISRDQISKYSKQMGLDKIPYDGLSKAWEDVYNVANYYSFGIKDIDKSIKLADAASAFVEIVNELARQKRKEDLNLIKKDAIKVIKNMLNDKDNFSEDSEGLEYLSSYAYNEIKELIKKGGLVQADLDEIDKNLFNPIWGYNMLKEDYNPIDYDLLNKIADRYNTSTPVSGDWDKETEHELNAIANELDITKAKAKALMIDKLGFEEDQFDFPIIEGKLSNEDKKYNSFRIAQLLDRQLDDGTGNIRVDSLDPSKIVLSTNIKDKDDEKLAEYIQRIEKFFSDIGFEATKEFNVRPDNETIKVIFTYKDIYDEGKDIDPLDEGLKGPDFLEFIELCKKLGFEKLTDVEEFKEKSNIQSDQDLLNALRDKLKNKSLERLQEWNIFPEDPKEDKIQEWVYAKWEDSKDYLDDEEYDYLERAIYEAEKGEMTWRELANQYFEYSEDEIELDDDEDLEDYPQPNPDEDDYDPVHEKEWMEKHPDGWYNNEHDYGYDDKNGVKRYMGGNLKENYFIIQNSRGKNMSKPSKQSDKLWEQLDAMEAQGLKNLKIVKYSMNKEGNK